MDSELIAELESIVMLIPKEGRPKINRKIKNYDLKLVSQIKNYVSQLQKGRLQQSGCCDTQSVSPKFTQQKSPDGSTLVHPQHQEDAELVSRVQEILGTDSPDKIVTLVQIHTNRYNSIQTALELCASEFSVLRNQIGEIKKGVVKIQHDIQDDVGIEINNIQRLLTNFPSQGTKEADATLQYNQKLQDDSLLMQQQLDILAQNNDMIKQQLAEYAKMVTPPKDPEEGDASPRITLHRMTLNHKSLLEKFNHLQSSYSQLLYRQIRQQSHEQSADCSLSISHGLADTRSRSALEMTGQKRIKDLSYFSTMTTSAHKMSQQTKSQIKALKCQVGQLTEKVTEQASALTTLQDQQYKIDEYDKVVGLFNKLNVRIQQQLLEIQELRGRNAALNQQLTAAEQENDQLRTREARVTQLSGMKIGQVNTINQILKAENAQLKSQIMQQSQALENNDCEDSSSILQSQKKDPNIQDADKELLSSPNNQVSHLKSKIIKLNKEIKRLTDIINQKDMQVKDQYYEINHLQHTIKRMGQGQKTGDDTTVKEPPASVERHTVIVNEHESKFSSAVRPQNPGQRCEELQSSASAPLVLSQCTGEQQAQQWYQFTAQNANKDISGPVRSVDQTQQTEDTSVAWLGRDNADTKSCNRLWGILAFVPVMLGFVVLAYFVAKQLIISQRNSGHIAAQQLKVELQKCKHDAELVKDQYRDISAKLDRKIQEYGQLLLENDNLNIKMQQGRFEKGLFAAGAVTILVVVASLVALAVSKLR